MPNPAVGLIVGGSSIGSALVQDRAAGKAARAQSAAAQLGIETLSNADSLLQELLKPYVQAGTPALQGQQNLLGLGGAGAQRQAIAGIENSPMFQSLTQQGEQAMLQNASATGGLRGGNLQGALAQYRPQMLNALIDQQYARLGDLTSLGQNAAVGVGNAGMQTGQNIANLYGQQGAASAGSQLARGQALSGVLNLPAQLSMMSLGAGGSGNPFAGMFGGGGAPAAPAVNWQTANVNPQPFNFLGRQF